ncbi:MAG: hypothetical protein IJ313_13795 [Clostridia bacterium]|nr:hypothetical protein [Clostridia bacterium]
MKVRGMGDGGDLRHHGPYGLGRCGGAPCRVHRAIDERDKEYSYRQYRVDAQM